MAITRSTASPPPPPPPHAGGKRKAANPPAEPPKKKRARKPPLSADSHYLQQSIAEFSAQNPPKKSQRHEILALALRYLRQFAMPRANDAHHFDSPAAARAFLSTTTAIKVPVFVRDGANYSMLDPHSPQRPIEQFLALLHDPGEEHECDDEAKPQTRSRDFLAVRDIKARFFFRANNRQSPPPTLLYPRNLTDIPNPMLDHGVPRFMANAQCTVLHDVMRVVLGVDDEDICVCPARARARARARGRCCCGGHKLTKSAYHALEHSWRYWQGTVMLAEPGCVTAPHWDKYGTGTWIACLEGEIGFGWQAGAGRGVRAGWLGAVGVPRGRWVFRVLRPGEAVYMPPGTVHLVFRRPGGGQTLAFAGQMLRRADLAEWLRCLRVEVEYALGDEEDGAPYEKVVPSLVEGLLKLINGVCKEREVEKFGGLEGVRELMGLIAKVDGVCDRIARLKGS